MDEIQISISESDVVNIDLDSNQVETLEQRIYKSYKYMSPLARKIFHLLDNTGQSVRCLSEKAECEYTTTSKYLKKFYELQIVGRSAAPASAANTKRTGRREFFYFIDYEVTEISSKIIKGQNRISPQFKGQYQSLGLLASKLKEFVVLLERLENLEQEVRELLGSDEVAELLIARLKGGRSTLP
ncbi:hypothetical protein [Nostoc sp. JL23]|uniref:hypothetical protein n=1 Tax=Nostoc sp. JL23 TaxID=2815394 RepID=UPI001D27CC1B|nr:hypothetical protein [Nostoc sp. JL23]MBN3875240.1 hypothetical protein [Nostoc sp. JL23]